MRFVSFNILSDDYVDFHDPKFVARYYNSMPASRLALQNRLPRLLRKIRSLDADVLMLQEVMTRARNALARQFPDYYVGPVAYHKFAVDAINRNRTGNAIMIRKSVCDSVPRWSRASIGFGYAIASATFRATPTGQDLTVHSIHLIDTPDKFKQVKALLRHLDLRTDVVVGGDFNSTSKKIRAAMRSRVPHGVELDQATLHFGTYLCEKPMIDYIYSTRPIELAKIDNAPVTETDRSSCFIRTLADIGSDHYPVIATIR